MAKYTIKKDIKGTVSLYRGNAKYAEISKSQLSWEDVEDNLPIEDEVLTVDESNDKVEVNVTLTLGEEEFTFTAVKGAELAEVPEESSTEESSTEESKTHKELSIRQELAKRKGVTGPVKRTLLEQRRFETQNKVEAEIELRKKNKK